MKIELEFANDFIADKLTEGMIRSAEWWIKTKENDVDELELKVQKILELAPNEIVEVDLEKAVNSLAWSRNTLDEWKQALTSLEKYKKKESTSDLIKKAKAMMK